MSTLNDRKENVEQLKKEGLGIIDHVVLAVIHLLRAKGSHFLPAIIALCAFLLVWRHPLIVAIVIVSLIRGFLNLEVSKAKDKEEKD